MKINRQALINALQAVKPGLARSLSIEQSTSFVFVDGAVCTYNDEIAVRHPIEVDFEGAVPAKELYDMLLKVKQEEVEFIIEEGTLLLKGGKSKTGLRIEEDVVLPIQDVGLPEDDDWVELPEKFAEGVKFALFSVSRDHNKPLLTCVHINSDFVESSDNNRITRFDMGEEIDDELLIPAFAAKSIVDYKPTEYALTDGWLHFKNEDEAVFSCRVFDEEYPDFSKFLEVDGTEIEFPDTINEILDRASVMCQDKRVTISLEKNKLNVAAEGANGWFEEPTRIKYSGDSLDFDIQPEFMKAMLKHKRTATIGNRLLFEGESFVHVVNLMEPKK